jgi:hypothetical protein
VWKVKELAALNEDEKVLFEICESMHSAEKEMLFLSGGHFVGHNRDIASMMEYEYKLTHSDYCHSRSWTKGFTEDQVTLDNRIFTLRDVGGDEVNRQQHWGNAIRDSFCSLFVVSLADFSKGEKFSEVRLILWTYLIDKELPKIILVLNKADVFAQKLKLIGLHEGCKDLESVPPKSEGESHDRYVKRCEQTVTDYFSKMPLSVPQTPLYRNRRKDACFDPEAVKLNGAFITRATDGQMLNGITDHIVHLPTNISSSKES